MRPRLTRWALGAAGVAVALGVWALFSRGPLTVTGVPLPGDVIDRLLVELQGAGLWQATLHTLQMTLIATALACVVGLVVGTAVGASPTAANYLSSTINVLRFVPPVALIPVLLLLFGFSSTSELVAGTFAAIWPILLNVAAVVGQLRDRYADLVRVERLGWLRQFRSIYLPGALEATVVGVRLGAALALILIVAVEMLAVSQGLGHQIQAFGDALRLPVMWAYVLWTGVVGLALNTALESGQRVLIPWERTS